MSVDLKFRVWFGGCFLPCTSQLIYVKVFCEMSGVSIPDKCFEPVEGIWKEFKIRRVLPTDYSLVLKHFCENFIRDEPTSKLLGWSEDFENDVCQVLSAILPQGMSFLAKHQQTGKVRKNIRNLNHNNINHM